MEEHVPGPVLRSSSPASPHHWSGLGDHQISALMECHSGESLPEPNVNYFGPLSYYQLPTVNNLPVYHFAPAENGTADVGSCTYHHVHGHGIPYHITNEYENDSNAHPAIYDPAGSTMHGSSSSEIGSSQ
jgi:hypothetical protein